MTTNKATNKNQDFDLPPQFVAKDLLALFDQSMQTLSDENLLDGVRADKYQTVYKLQNSNSMEQ